MKNNKSKLSWGHININVQNLDQSIEFYTKLGFEIFIPGVPYFNLRSGSEKQKLENQATEALGINHSARGRACIMQLNNGFPKIDLTEFSGLEQRNPLSNSDLGIVRICLITKNIKRSVEALKLEGVEFISEPRLVGHGGLGEVAICKDLDGALIELLQVRSIHLWASIRYGYLWKCLCSYLKNITRR